MKKLLILCSIILLFFPDSYTQNLRSLRNKLENAIVDEVIDDVFEDSDGESEESNSSTGESSDKPSQKSGGSGLDTSLDDVPDALAQASTEFNAKEYRNARTSLRKALRTLEIKIGQQLIASLPENVQGLPVKTEADNITSSGETWVGLTVRREYQKNDTWAAITIYNGSASGLASFAIYSGMNTSYSEENENQKQVVIKGNDAVITYSDSEGYAIGMSAGLQTFIAIEGVNVTSEAEMMAIAESFDYEKIMKTLGDQ